MKTTGNKPKITWDKTKFSTFKVFRKQEVNSIVKGEEGAAGNAEDGIRTMSKSEGKAARKKT